MFPVSSSNRFKLKLTIAPQTDEVPPRPARVDGPLRVSAVTGGGTFEPDPDGDPLSVILVSESTPGETTFNLEADADLGAGERLISETVVYTTTETEASTLGISVSAPILK